MIDAFSVNRTSVKPINDNTFDPESPVDETSTLLEVNNDTYNFEDAVEQQTFIGEISQSNANRLLSSVVQKQQANPEKEHNEPLGAEKLSSQTVAPGFDPMQTILQQTQMLSLASEDSLTGEIQAELIHSDLANSTAASVNQSPVIDAQMLSLASSLQQSTLASVNELLSNTIPQNTPKALNDVIAPASFKVPTTNKVANALSSSLTLTQPPSVTMASVNELLSNQNNELANIKLMFQATQSRSTFNSQQSTPLFTEQLIPSTTPAKGLQNNQPEFSQFPPHQQVISTQLSRDFSFVDETQAEFSHPTRFSPFNATEQTTVANWQMHPAMTEVKDVPVMQLTPSTLDKPPAENASQRAMGYGLNHLEQQRTQQLQQLVSTGNFTEVTVKDSKLGDIHFSVSGKQKEHLGVLVTQSQTLNVVQTHLVEIQQELADEGVTDFEMFSSKEEQEQQKREYFAQQAKSFVETQQELEDQDLPIVKASIIGKYHPSSINITA